MTSSRPKERTFMTGASNFPYLPGSAGRGRRNPPRLVAGLDDGRSAAITPAGSGRSRRTGRRAAVGALPEGIPGARRGLFRCIGDGIPDIWPDDKPKLLPVPESRALCHYAAGKEYSGTLFYPAFRYLSANIRTDEKSR